MASRPLPLKSSDGDWGTPRALMEKGSPPWCYRTLERLRWALEQKRIDEAEYDKVLGELKEYEAWNRIPEGKPYGDLGVMLKAEIGYTEQQGREVAIAASSGERVLEAAEETTGEVRPEGQSTYYQNLVVGARSKRARDNGVSHETQRKLDCLKRDFPDYHERVKVGELSVHRACVLAGIAEPTITIYIKPSLGARQLARRLTRAELTEWYRLIGEVLSAEESSDACPLPHRADHSV